MKHVTVTEAKAKFSDLLTAVESGETVVVTRHGQVIARIMPDEERRKRRVREAIEGILDLRKHTKPATIEEIVAWKNEGRA